MSIALSHCWAEMDLRVVVSVFTNKLGGTFVRAKGVRYEEDRPQEPYFAERIYHPYKGNLLGLMLECIHEVYHRCDRRPDQGLEGHKGW